MPQKSFIFILLVFFLFMLNYCDQTTFHIFGPGIQFPQLAFPSQYFFVLHSQPIGQIRVITKCRIWTQVFNETQFCVKIPKEIIFSQISTFQELINHTEYCYSVNNKSSNHYLTIVRYKIYDEFCDDGFKVEIINNHDKIVYNQNIKTILRSEKCPCPTNDWSDKLQCSNSLSNKALSKQINNDLEPFQEDGIDFDNVLKIVQQQFASHPRTYAFCLYQIINGQLYKRCYGEYVGFSKFFDEILLSLLRKQTLSNTEFIFNLGDWPLALKKKSHLKLPIFSWCGSEDTFDIVLPTYELTESILHSQDRIATDILSLFGQQSSSFRIKENKLFWRGRDSHRSRLNLISLASQSSNASLYNVSITNFFFFRNEMEKYSSASSTGGKHVPFIEFFKYKYQLNIDGSVAAYRFPFLLAGNSVVLKQNSTYYEFFYKSLLPNEHFIMVDDELSNLDSILKDLSDKKDLTFHENLIWKSRKFVLEHLLPENVFCYYMNALEKYTLLLFQSNIQIRAGCERINSTTNIDYSLNIDICKCNYTQSRHLQKYEL